MTKLQEAGNALATACRPLFDDPAQSWCRDFMLGADASSDIAMLTDTRPLAHATVISVVMAGVEESGILRGAADGAIAIDFYLVPTISVGVHSVGMAIQRYSRGCNVEFGTGRYVVNNQTGELLILWTESLHKDHVRRQSSSAEMFAAIATLVNGRSPRIPSLRSPDDDEDDEYDPSGSAAASASARGGRGDRRTLRVQWIAPRRDSAHKYPRGTLCHELEDLSALCDTKLFTAGRYEESILVSHRTSHYNRHACEACMDANATPAGSVDELSELFESACSCSAPLRTPAPDGLDWGAQVSNVEAHAGLYRGRTDVNFCLPGATPSCVSFVKLTSTQLRVSKEYIVADNIRQVALQSRMRQSNPVSQIMPFLHAGEIVDYPMQLTEPQCVVGQWSYRERERAWQHREAKHCGQHHVRHDYTEPDSQTSAQGYGFQLNELPIGDMPKVLIESDLLQEQHPQHGQQAARLGSIGCGVLSGHPVRQQLSETLPRSQLPISDISDPLTGSNTQPNVGEHVPLRFATQAHCMPSAVDGEGTGRIDAPSSSSPNGSELRSSPSPPPKLDVYLPADNNVVVPVPNPLAPAFQNPVPESKRTAVAIAPRPSQSGLSVVVDEARESRLRERRQRNRAVRCWVELVSLTAKHAFHSFWSLTYSVCAIFCIYANLWPYVYVLWSSTFGFRRRLRGVMLYARRKMMI